MFINLVITATSGPPECLFSKSGLILTELRNRLNPAKLDQLRFYGQTWTINFLIILKLVNLKLFLYFLAISLLFKFNYCKFNLYVL